LKKKLLSLILSVTLLLPVLPHMAGSANEMLDSGDITMKKMTKAEIAELLEQNSLDLPLTVYDEELSVTAPYAQGKVNNEALQAAVNRLNALHKIAGLPEVELDADLCNLSQYGAAIEVINGELTHFPTQPADMDNDFYKKAKTSTTRSNISVGSTLTQAVDSFMDDSDGENVEDVGHRRWQLNPKMGKTGFGCAENPDARYNRFVTEYFADQSGAGCDFEFIGWPASGYFPNNLEGFNRNSAWSVSLDSQKYAAPSGITVTLTRESDGQKWTLSGSYSDKSSGKYLNVDLADQWNYSETHCIIFRPDGIQKYEGVYTVEIDGLKSRSGSAIDFAYKVEFFEPENISEQPEKPEKPEQPSEPEKPEIGMRVNTTGLHSFGGGLAIKSDGRLVGWGKPYVIDGINVPHWGDNNGIFFGKATDGSVTDLDCTKYMAISEEGYSAVGLTEDGTAETWGILMELGAVHFEPLPVMEDVLKIVHGSHNNLFLNKKGEVWLSDGNIDGTKLNLTRIFTQFDDVVQIAKTYNVLFALRKNGSLWVSGPGLYGESGLTKEEWNAAGNPDCMKAMDDVAYVSADYGAHVVAVKKDGSLWSWGRNVGGTVGNGYQCDLPGRDNPEDYYQTNPVKIMDGKLYGLGDNNNGELGFTGGDMTYKRYHFEGDFICQSRPKYITDNVVDVFVGDDYTLIQKADGSLWATGSNEEGLTAPNAKEQFVKIMDDVKLMTGTPVDITTPEKLERPSRPDGSSHPSRPSGSSSSRPSSFGKEDDGSSRKDKTKQEPEQPTAPTNTGADKRTDSGNSTISFQDVHSGEYYYAAVQRAVGKGVTAGTSQTVFSPNMTCTRSQVVTFLWRAMGCPEPTVQSNPFADLSANDYFYKAVLWAYEKGITSGVTATAFGSEGPCTRGQFAAFLWRANGQPAASGGTSFTDVSAEDYFANAVSWAVEQGIITGTGNGAFSPNAPCTRAQIVTFLYRDSVA